MRLTRVGDVVVLVLLLALAVVLGYFAVQNANRYWEANHPPEGAEPTSAEVVGVETEELCGHTTRSITRCVTEVDGLEVRLADGSTHRVPAHAVFSPGDRVRAFEDGDGDWQVEGAFSRAWALRTVGATALPALVVLGIVGASLRPRRGRDTLAERG